MTDSTAPIPEPEGLTDAAGEEAAAIVNRVANDLMDRANQALVEEAPEDTNARAWLMVSIIVNMAANLSASLALAGSTDEGRRLLHRHTTQAIDRAWRAGETMRAGGTQ